MTKSKSKIHSQQLFVRQSTLEDIPQIVDLSERIFGDLGWTAKMIRATMNVFPEGQFVVEVEGNIVGHCATFIIDGKHALKPHSWNEITGNGYAARHDPEGDYLYGMEVAVDPNFRGLRIGQRLYDARKSLCQNIDLKGIIFGGRLVGYSKKASKVSSPEEYVELVLAKKMRDPVIGFQIRNGFEYLGILKNYIPQDKESMGFATHMIWQNPLCSDHVDKKLQQINRPKETVRLASVQFQMRKVNSFEDFIKHVEHFVDVAADYRSDFVLFPELFTMALLSIENKKIEKPEEAMRKISGFTPQFVEAMRKMAISYNINIIGGTHPTLVGDELRNIAYIFLRGGEVHQQEKIHATPNEVYWWGMTGGNDTSVIQTDCGPIGILICYDSEFPELARHLCDQGALILFVPFCTDQRQAFLRVRYCSHARAIENQVYVATAGVVGNMPDVDNMDIHYAQSHIFTPCDFPFAREGIAAEASPNTEMIIFADLNLSDLVSSRTTGSVKNFKDRRFDLYEIKWNKK